MDIGTAKPTIEQRQGIPHHLIDIRDPDKEWTVSDFVEETKHLIPAIEARGNVPMIVGGTGLYLWALLEGFVFPIAPADKKLRQEFGKEDLSILYSRLNTVDPVSAQKINPNDKKRIIRALEVFKLTGKPISQIQRSEEPRISFLGSEPILIGLNLPRDLLYRRIEERVDRMMAAGLIDEVKGLLAKGLPKDLPSFQALGYKEVIDYLDGKWDKETMVSELKKRTRNFARRQMTWFKRFKNVQWFDATIDSRAIIDYITEHDQNPPERN
jgi:tRNA dimethylallyltransferase